MEYISLSIISLRSNKEHALATNSPFLNLSPDFQRNYESWDEQMLTRFIETMLLNRATNPIWSVLNSEDDSEEILDGQHRLKTALSFLNNEFSLKSKYFMNLNKEEYDKKKFNDLSSDDKAKIRNYNFIINKLDSTYKENPNKLRDMYEILNRSSKTLNDYEFNKVLYKDFFKIITKFKTQILDVDFFKTNDVRGNIDSDIIEMLCLSYEIPNSWASMSSLSQNWMKNTIGSSSEEIESFLNKEEENIKNRLEFLGKIMKDVKEKIVSDDKKIFKREFKIYKFIVARCCFYIKNYSLFNRIFENLKTSFNKYILVENIEGILSCNSRNASFQRKLIEKIDEIIKNEVSNSPTRFFSKKMISDKLKEQNNKCPKCDKIINPSDDYEGDHIKSWTSGGETSSDNLQVLHKRCHQLKN
jgi:hypothetical protein